ncbi:MAG: hypothetical protein KL840_18300 [Aquamicrobium sp.]|nr:hypothetical protein [Aquamicrobium sp.]
MELDLGAMGSTPVGELAASAGIVPGDSGLAVPAPGETRPDGTPYDQPPAEEPGLGDASGLDAIAGGALKSVFETKDFLFGDTPEDDRSQFRANVEDTVERRQQESIFDGFSAEVAQFATAMIGLGKLRTAAAALPWVGAGLATLGSSKKGVVAVEMGQAALAGAIAFDPHEERLSNVIQDTALANPLNAWLAADPEDSAAEGRMKAAFESIALDSTLMGVFVGAGRIWKHLRKGDMEKAAEEAARMEKEASDAIAAEQSSEPGTVRPDGEPDAPSAIPEGGAEGLGEVAPGDTGSGDGGLGVSSQEGAAEPSAGRREPEAGTLREPEAIREDASTGTQGAAAEEVPVEVVSSPTEAMQQAGTEGPKPTAKPGIKFDDEDTAAVLSGMEADAEAISRHGGWYQAIEAGHTFGKGEGIPYRKLNTEADVDDFMARVVDAAEERLDALKGGDIMSDARVDSMVRQRAKLFDDDPALLLGMVQKAGRDAASVVANMEAGYLVANKMFQDAYALAARINLGDFSGAGSKDMAMEELRQRLSLASSVYGAAKSMSSNAGRSLRRMRGEFKIDPKQVEALKGLDGDALAELIFSTKGDPRNMARLVNGSMFSKVVDFASFVYVNNLVSGPMTQFINATTNAYMVGVRPLERIIGSVVMDAVKGTNSRAILKESVTQYTYMGHAFTEGFRNATKAFLKNDSIITPHRSEVYAGNDAGERAGAMIPFKKWDSTPNMLYNVFAAMPAQAIGVPTRVLGTVDELVKQTVYRSKVMAGAYWEAVNKGQQTGLSGKDLEDFVKQYVTDKTHAAFDVEGRGVNANALREANIATFQQDLNPGTLGRTAQLAVSQHPSLRLVLPFVKTPVNVMRYGWKLTPGLNVLQMEYRQMLRGEMGVEAQRQAVGQMSLGALFLGSAAYLVSQGRLTGAGPRDPRAREAWMAAGGVPYSVWWENADGSVTSIPYNRYDPVALPFGIIADLQDVMTAAPETEDSSEAGAIFDALKLSAAAQMKNKTFLMGISQALDFFMEPDRSSFGSSVAANFLPFSAAQRQFNTDPYLREARDLTDKLMATIPGLSENVPARYDPFGDPITTRKGLWSNKEYDAVDLEVTRLAVENGSTISRPSPNHNGVDLRDVTLAGSQALPGWTGRNAYAVYQELAGQMTERQPSLKSIVAKVMASDAYRRAPDGDMATKGTKLWMLHGPIERYRKAAFRFLLRDPAVREAVQAKQLKVVEHYRGQPARRQQPEPSLGQVGKSFGAELDALLGPVRQPASP